MPSSPRWARTARAALLVSLFAAASALPAQIRIVEPTPSSPTSLPASSFFPTPRREPDPVPPRNPLRSLAGRRFELVQDGYKYQFFPFHNLSQIEDTLRWNAFRGIIGLWGRPTRSTGQRTTHLYDDGSACSLDVHRETKVIFECGRSDEDEGIVAVEETAACRYEMRFVTPLACGVDGPSCGAQCPSLAVPWLQDRAEDCAGGRGVGVGGGGDYMCTADPWRLAWCNLVGDPHRCCGGGVAGGVCCRDGEAAIDVAGRALVAAVRGAALKNGQEAACRPVSQYAASCGTPRSSRRTVVCSPDGVGAALDALDGVFA